MGTVRQYEPRKLLTLAVGSVVAAVSLFVGVKGLYAYVQFQNLKADLDELTRSPCQHIAIPFESVQRELPKLENRYRLPAGSLVAERLPRCIHAVTLDADIPVDLGFLEFQWHVRYVSQTQPL
jgi:hypothetical protein